MKLPSICYWFQLWVNIGSGNGLVPSGTKPLPEPILTKFHDTVKPPSESHVGPLWKIMALRHNAPSHYLNQCWSHSKETMLVLTYRNSRQRRASKTANRASIFWHKFFFKIESKKFTILKVGQLKNSLIHWTLPYGITQGPLVNLSLGVISQIPCYAIYLHCWIWP